MTMRKAKKALKTLSALLICSVLIMLSSCVLPWDNNQGGNGEELIGYFFDSEAAPNGDGSKEWPFNDLEMIKTITLKEGENIYIRSGSHFYGSFELISISGTKEKPVKVTNYGAGPKPKIDGNDCQGTGVLYVKNCSFITIENLELYDSESSEGDRRGVLLDATNPDGLEEMITYEGITLKNLYIHDIKGYLDALNNGMSTASKATGGIQFWSSDGYGRFLDLTITECVIENVDNVGIASKKAGRCDPYDSDFKEYAFENVKITHNEIFNIGKNAIFLRNAYNALIEHNVVHDTAVRCYTGNQIVTRSVDTVLIQFNEGYRNMAIKNPLPGSGLGIMDGSMLDADLLSRNTVWQYNYSHDNSFGLFINCTGQSGSDVNAKDTAIVRFNLSVNDRGNKGIVYINYYSAGIEVYNNTIITTTEPDAVIFQANDNRAFSFYNNLIFNRSLNARFAPGNMAKGSFSNNLVYSTSVASITNLAAFSAVNPNGVYQNPLIWGNVGATIEDRIGERARDVCRLLEGSPAFEAGIDIEGVLTDMFGNSYRNVIGCSFN